MEFLYINLAKISCQAQKVLVKSFLVKNSEKKSKYGKYHRYSSD